MPPTRAARISNKDESDLEWYHVNDRESSDAASDGFGIARLYSGEAVECKACLGWGYTGAKKNRYSVSNVDYLELLGLVAEQSADAGSKGGSCKKCGGRGHTPKHKLHGKRVSSSPMQGGSAPCTACKGLCGNDCEECEGEGFVHLDLVGFSHGVTKGGTSHGKESDAHMQRAARVSRRINLCNAQLRGSRLVLVSYYGGLYHKCLSTRWGRIASVFHLTPSGLALLREYELDGSFASAENMVEIVKGTRCIEGVEKKRDALLKAAHGQAIRLYGKVCVAWNQGGASK